MNKIIVIGHLGRDPEMRYTPNGQAVTSFSVASSRRYTTSAGEQKEETEWFNVSAWGKLGETCNQYLAKGRQVYVEGRLSSRSYEARDGTTRFSNDISLTSSSWAAGVETATERLHRRHMNRAPAPWQTKPRNSTR